MSKREEPHNEKLDFYNVLDEEWERLLDRKGGCLSFSMAPTPSVAPPVDPLPPPTPRAPSSPTPAPIDDSNTSMAPDAATPSSPISSPSSPISSPGGTETVAPSTFQPPACEELDRADAILASVRSISPDVDPNDTESPSGFAVNWITNDDEAQRNPCTDDILPRYALVTLYAATQGTFWTNQTGWLTKESECEWYAVTCNDENQVESLELSKFIVKIIRSLLL